MLKPIEDRPKITSQGPYQRKAVTLGAAKISVRFVAVCRTAAEQENRCHESKICAFELCNTFISQKPAGNRHDGIIIMRRYGIRSPDPSIQPLLFLLFRGQCIS